ncbi:MAG: hypothetical protein C0415_00610 [Thermodesulfovibrio sp.]|nr:hypothetical protein [Thermodesulfovibrio sp.]
MKDMKNGIQKNSSIKKTKSFLDPIGDFREKHEDDIARIFPLVFFSLISSLIILEGRGIEYFIGSFLITTFILFLFYKDIKRYKPAYIRDYKMLLLLCVLVPSTLFMGKIFAYLNSGLNRGLGFPEGLSFIFGLPIPVGAMLVTLIFDFHTALIFSLLISLLTGIWLDNPFYPLYAFIGSLTAAFSVIRCKKRSALIKGGIYISAVSIVTAGVIMLLSGGLFSHQSASAFLFAAISGLFVAGIVSIVLPAIEYLFGIRTDISLIELLDLDQPLMHSLMINAPGTYHHSVIVGNLAESSAEAVGANPLLARVTAYYHDIGKIKIPEYFVENQTGTVSKHDKLTPHMSSIILISHVKEGIDLARQYKLPESVIDIIQQHHGTSLMTYFYQKAMEQKTIEIPFHEDYRYPGPKPQTRVAAIVMMADAVEAASRTLTDPTPARIEALVEKIINNVFLDGQIDECEITLKDLSEIKKRFTYILNSIFHRRIEYPELTVKSVSYKTDKTLSEKGMKTNGDNNKEQTKTDKDKLSENSKDIKESTHTTNPQG